MLQTSACPRTVQSDDRCPAALVTTAMPVSSPVRSVSLGRHRHAVCVQADLPRAGIRSAAPLTRTCRALLVPVRRPSSFKTRGLAVVLTNTPLRRPRRPMRRWHRRRRLRPVAREADPVAIPHVLGKQLLGQAGRRRLAGHRHQAVGVVRSPQSSFLDVAVQRISRSAPPRIRWMSAEA